MTGCPRRCPVCEALGTMVTYWALFGKLRARRQILRCLACNTGGVLAP